MPQGSTVIDSLDTQEDGVSKKRLEDFDVTRRSINAALVRLEEEGRQDSAKNEHSLTIKLREIDYEYWPKILPLLEELEAKRDELREAHHKKQLDLEAKQATAKEKLLLAKADNKKKRKKCLLSPSRRAKRRQELEEFEQRKVAGAHTTHNPIGSIDPSHQRHPVNSTNIDNKRMRLDQPTTSETSHSNTGLEQQLLRFERTISPAGDMISEQPNTLSSLPRASTIYFLVKPQPGVTMAEMMMEDFLIVPEGLHTKIDNLWWCYKKGICIIFLEQERGRKKFHGCARVTLVPEVTSFLLPFPSWSRKANLENSKPFAVKWESTQWALFRDVGQVQRKLPDNLYDTDLKSFPSYYQLPDSEIGEELVMGIEEAAARAINKASAGRRAW
ncbi:hypothetical protein BT63DRAFT_436297 [Microthyrium microscopicum]|uniref:YTH domain-containing protein n=1 Tax=Microthyrium microscopicum TaxID=703497 RepID=A0A6A6UWP3_9PEZI|nr:hypothetical protein BT63DRAFT_436297 [Microthyrium microscopicum]